MQMIRHYSDSHNQVLINREYKISKQEWFAKLNNINYDKGKDSWLFLFYFLYLSTFSVSKAASKLRKCILRI